MTTFPYQYAPMPSTHMALPGIDEPLTTLDARKIDPNSFEKFMLDFLSEGKQILLGLNVISIPKLSKETENSVEIIFQVST